MSDAPNTPLVSVHNRMEIRFFQKRGKPSLLSVSAMNLLVRILRSLVNPSVVAGNRWDFMITDSNLVLVVPASLMGSGSGINYRGTYDNSQAYAVGDVVRVIGGIYPQGLFICMQAQAPSGAPPALPEAGNWDQWAFGPVTFHYEDYANSCTKMKMTINGSPPAADS